MHFSHCLFILCGSYEYDPLSPPEREAAQGEHPLDPRFLGFASPFLMAIALLGDARAAGAKSTMCCSPQERFFVSHQDINIIEKLKKK
jgi:hypothetical protein